MFHLIYIFLGLKLGILIEENSNYKLVFSNKIAKKIFDFSLLITANFIDSYFACTQKIKIAIEQSSNLSSLTLKLLDQVRAAYLNGTVEFAECASKVVIQNALKLFLKIGIINFENDKPTLKNRNNNIKYQEILYVLEKAHYNRVFS